jgi:hypothetical protein
MLSATTSVGGIKRKDKSGRRRKEMQAYAAL